MQLSYPSVCLPKVQPIGSMAKVKLSPELSEFGSNCSHRAIKIVIVKKLAYSGMSEAYRYEPYYKCLFFFSPRIPRHL
jgi:hypothetical protein